MSAEHVIPKSLGGNASTVIFVERGINNTIGSQVDGKIAKDPMVTFGRRDTGAKGHAKKKATPEFRNAVFWDTATPLGIGGDRHTVRFPGDHPKILNNRSRQFLPTAALNVRPLVVWDMNIDHEARLKFTLKTLLGVGWKLFGEDILSAIDADFVRKVLVSPIAIGAGHSEGGLTFEDGFLPKDDAAAERYRRLEKAAVIKSKTTILMRQEGQMLHWTVSCLGYFVGSVWLPARDTLLPKNLSAGDALHLIFGASAYDIAVVDRHELEA